MNNNFLPISMEDMKIRGWDICDFIIITGDAYVDHPSFGTAIISRVLESKGYKVGIIAQPDVTSNDDFTKLGQPRLAFLVTSGNMDSMVNRYTASKKKRKQDAYSPGGKTGYRPDRAVIVYSNKIREVYKNVSILIGGIESSLRRFAHYDYWSDTVRRSILFDSKADLLAYGMGESHIVEIAECLNNGIELKNIFYVKGTCYKLNSLAGLDGYTTVPSYEHVRDDKKEFARCFKKLSDEQDPVRGRIIVQPHGDSFLVQNPPSMPLTSEQMDKIYELPYTGTYHPVYESSGGIPAIDEVKFSITSSRGCFGSCSFCALAFHQGRIVSSRSHESIIREAEKLTRREDFKGYIHDVGGPTANFRKSACDKQLQAGSCINKSCLYPEVCKSIKPDHTEYLELLRKLRNIDGVKKVFIRSGIRYDYALADRKTGFIEEIAKHHISGHLKIAPEHVSPDVLRYMRKPGLDTFDRFCSKFETATKNAKKEQYILPYFISSHPGSGLEDAIMLAEYMRDHNIHPEQVQDFYPTPGTASTVMYYTGYDPYTMKEVYVPKGLEKEMQRALLQYKDKRNAETVRTALIKAGREDLIGYGKKALVAPDKDKSIIKKDELKDELNENKKYESKKNKSYDEFKKEYMQKKRELNNRSKKGYKDQPDTKTVFMKDNKYKDENGEFKDYANYNKQKRFEKADKNKERSYLNKKTDIRSNYNKEEDGFKKFDSNYKSKNSSERNKEYGKSDKKHHKIGRKGYQNDKKRR